MTCHLQQNESRDMPALVHLRGIIYRSTSLVPFLLHLAHRDNLDRFCSCFSRAHRSHDRSDQLPVPANYRRWSDSCSRCLLCHLCLSRQRHFFPVASATQHVCINHTRRLSSPLASGKFSDNILQYCWVEIMRQNEVEANLEGNWIFRFVLSQNSRQNEVEANLQGNWIFCFALSQNFTQGRTLTSIIISSYRYTVCCLKLVHSSPITLHSCYPDTRYCPSPSIPAPS